jgi:small conductance mechanosensitive channel
MEIFTKIRDIVIEIFTNFGLKILAALVIAYVGFQVAKFARSLVRKIMAKANIDTTLVLFASSATYIVINAFFLIAALEKLGVQTTSFIAVLGAAGLAIGLALQGSLSNFAAGVLMLIFRPFKVGDLIQGGGVFGTVEELHVFTTTIKTPDSIINIVPNSKIFGDTITNYSADPCRRVDLTFAVSPKTNIDEVKSLAMSVMENNEWVLKEPAPEVAVMEIADGKMTLVVRPWTAPENYWSTYFSVTEGVKKRFDAAGIALPVPQRDVYVHGRSLEEEVN